MYFLNVSLNILSMIALWLGPYRGAQAAWVLIVAGVLALAWGPGQQVREKAAEIGLRESVDYEFAKDSHYQFVKVYEKKSGEDSKRKLRVLSLDYLIHGYIDLNDPFHLEYEYEKIYRDIAKRFARRRTQSCHLFEFQCFDQRRDGKLGTVTYRTERCDGFATYRLGFVQAPYSADQQRGRQFCVSTDVSECLCSHLAKQRCLSRVHPARISAGVLQQTNQRG